MLDFIFKLKNLWKKNFSFFLVICIFFSFEIPYITSIQGNESLAWYKCINYFFVFLLAIPALLALLYIIYMRTYIPKAPKNTRGIIFYIINANEKQYEAIRKKFISQLEKAIHAEAPEYSVVIIDDYHSQKFFPILNAPTNNKGGEKQAEILKKRRGCIAILIDCLNGGDGEDLFCHMTTNVGITYKNLPPQISNYLIKDISTAFLPLRDVDIMKLTETSDLSRHSISMEVVCKYILASTCFHCGDFSGAIKLLKAIDNKTSTKKDLPEAVIPIKNVLSKRLAICYKITAEQEYQLFCSNHENKHLLEVRNAINNEYCKKEFEQENKVFEGICSFVLDRNIDYALQCMDEYNKNTPVIKYNKIFLLLYKGCSVKNIFKTYNLYKSYGALHNNIQEQIESFTYHEYKKDKTKKQLLLILFLIYDYQNNTILAKRCLEQFCDAFPWIFNSNASLIFKNFKKKYADVKYEEGEDYSI